MKTHLLVVVVIVAVLLAQQSRACAPSCTGASVTSNRVVVVSGLDGEEFTTHATIMQLAMFECLR